MEPEITKKDIAFMSKEQRAELIAKVKDQDQPANESVQSDGDMTPNEPMIEQKPIAVKENQQSVSPDNVPSPTPSLTSARSTRFFRATRCSLT